MDNGTASDKRTLNAMKVTVILLPVLAAPLPLSDTIVSLTL